MPAVSAINTWVIAYVIIVLVIWIYYWWEKRDTLTPDELETFNDIMTQFHEDPVFSEFNEIYVNRERLIKQCGRSVKYWLWGVYIKYPTFFTETRRNVIASYIREIQRGLRRIKAKPTGELMDCIWSIYFATGDVNYANIIKDIAINSTDFAVAGAATWSYTQIMGQSPHIVGNPTPENEIPPADNNTNEVAPEDNATDTSADTHIPNTNVGVARESPHGVANWNVLPVPTDIITQ